jgi:hypothetical protein
MATIGAGTPHMVHLRHVAKTNKREGGVLLSLGAVGDFFDIGR